MSDLQLSLLAAGAVLIVIVYIYNKWQERRHRKLAESVFRDEQPDVLMGGSRVEAESATEKLYDQLELDDDVSLQNQDQDDRREPSLSSSDLTAANERIEPIFEPLMNDSEAPTYEARETTKNTRDESEPIQPAALLEPVEIPVLRSVPPVNVEPAVHQAPVIPLIPPIPLDLSHPECDAVITLELTSPKNAHEILRAQAAAFGKVHTPVFWLGLNADQQWQILEGNTRGDFKHLRVVVQLANRQGPITEQEVILLHNTVQEIAVQWNAVLDLSDLESALNSALQRGRQLDQFCVEVDLQIGINLIGPTPFPGTKIRALAEAAGMSINADGMFEKQDDAGRALFTLSNQEANPFAAETLKLLKTHSITFVLDVPRVAETGFVFDHMLRLAKQFSEALQARIVDDNRRPLGDAQLSSIREQFVIKPLAEMTAKRIPSGSILALRLFS